MRDTPVSPVFPSVHALDSWFQEEKYVVPFTVGSREKRNAAPPVEEHTPRLQECPTMGSGTVTKVRPPVTLEAAGDASEEGRSRVMGSVGAFTTHEGALPL